MLYFSKYAKVNRFFLLLQFVHVWHNANMALGLMPFKAFASIGDVRVTVQGYNEDDVGLVQKLLILIIVSLTTY